MEEIIDYPVRSRAIAGGCPITAMTIVGNMALFVRMMVVLGITFAGSVMLALSLGFTVPSPVLWVCFIVNVLAIVIIASDASAIKWMVEKLINELGRNLQSLRESLGQLQNSLVESQKQIAERDVQLQLSADQLKKQTELVEKSALIQANMKTLLESMMNASSEGADLNKIFEQNIKKFEKLLDKMAHNAFSDMDVNHDGHIDESEFRVYTSRSMHRAIKGF